MSRVIVATHARFWQKRNGCDIRILGLVEELLAEKFEIAIFFLGSLSSENIQTLKNLGIARVEFVYDGPTLIYKHFFNLNWAIWANFFTYLKKIFNRSLGVENQLSFFSSKTVKKKFSKYIRDINPDCVLIEYIRLAYLIDNLDNDFKGLLLIDTHDVMHKRYQSFKDQGLTHWIKINRDEEKEVLSKFDKIIAIQEEDAVDFERLMTGKEVVVLSHCIKPKKLVKPSRRCLRIGYIGGGNQVNLKGLKWFLDNVWMRVLASGLSVEMVVAGRICEKLSSCESKDFSIIGAVDNVEDFYREIDIAVNPVFSGGGLKIKNLEALAYGTPLVTTAVGAQGFPCLEESPFFVCVDAKTFYERLVSLLTSIESWPGIEARSLEYVSTHFSRGKIREVFSPANDQGV